MGGIETSVEINGSFRGVCDAPENMLRADQLASTPISQWDSVIQNSCAPANPEEFEGNLRNMIDPADGKFDGRKFETHAFNLAAEVQRAVRQDLRLRDGQEPNSVDMPSNFEGNGVLMELHGRYAEGAKTDMLARAEQGENVGGMRGELQERFTGNLQEVQAYAADRIDAVMDEIRNPTPEMEMEAPANDGESPRVSEPLTQDI